MTNGGRTVGVLGTSLDRYAVPRNRSLKDAIGARHLLVSQFPGGQPTHRSHFPLRNKTMALLSDATLIVEAATNSGNEAPGMGGDQAWAARALPQTVARDAVAGLGRRDDSPWGLRLRCRDASAGPRRSPLPMGRVGVACA